MIHYLLYSFVEFDWIWAESKALHMSEWYTAASWSSLVIKVRDKENMTKLANLIAHSCIVLAFFISRPESCPGHGVSMRLLHFWPECKMENRETSRYPFRRFDCENKKT